jgi:hypothetical protein
LDFGDGDKTRPEDAMHRLGCMGGAGREASTLALAARPDQRTLCIGWDAWAAPDVRQALWRWQLDQIRGEGMPLRVASATEARHATLAPAGEAEDMRGRFSSARMGGRGDGRGHE